MVSETELSFSNKMFNHSGHLFLILFDDVKHANVTTYSSVMTVRDDLKTRQGNSENAQEVQKIRK